MRLTASTDIDRSKDNIEDALKFTTLALEQIGQILNNGLFFSDNFNAKILTITFSAANVDVGSLHGLGRVPTGYQQIGQSAAAIVYDGASANSTSLLYLKSSAVAQVRILVF